MLVLDDQKTRTESINKHMTHNFIIYSQHHRRDSHQNPFHSLNADLGIADLELGKTFQYYEDGRGEFTRLHGAIQFHFI